MRQFILASLFLTVPLTAFSKDQAPNPCQTFDEDHSAVTICKFNGMEFYGAKLQGVWKQVPTQEDLKNAQVEAAAKKLVAASTEEKKHGKK